MLSPGVDAAHTMHVEVYVEIDETATLDLIRMTSRFEVFLSIVPGTDAERLETFNT